MYLLLLGTGGRKLRSLASMAEVLAKRSLPPPYRRRYPTVTWGVRRTPSSLSLPRGGSRPKAGPLKSSSWRSGFCGRRLILEARDVGKPDKGPPSSGPVQMTLTIGRKAPKWWEKGLQSNMKDIESAQDLIDSLLNAGDKLVIVDFFSPSCAGCKSLHPKICQFAEMNPDVQFLQVNHEKHKPMCYSLNVHVLPFFRFYRGAHDRLCSFSCTIATIKKFKDALAKHNTDRCSLGPVRGLEESELLAFAAKKDLSFTYAGNSVPVPKPAEVTVTRRSLAQPVLAVPSIAKESDDKALVGAGR